MQLTRSGRTGMVSTTGPIATLPISLMVSYHRKGVVADLAVCASLLASFGGARAIRACYEALRRRKPGRLRTRSETDHRFEDRPSSVATRH
jgi:hypothetical protein